MLQEHFAFEVHFKKSTKISSKTVEEVTAVLKTVHFLKSINVTDNGTKKVPRYCPTLHERHGTNTVAAVS